MKWVHRHDFIFDFKSTRLGCGVRHSWGEGEGTESGRKRGGGLTSTLTLTNTFREVNSCAGMG